LTQFFPSINGSKTTPILDHYFCKTESNNFDTYGRDSMTFEVLFIREYVFFKKEIKQC